VNELERDGPFDLKAIVTEVKAAIRFATRRTPKASQV
jgi:hypothetical protein